MARLRACATQDKYFLMFVVSFLRVAGVVLLWMCVVTDHPFVTCALDAKRACRCGRCRGIGTVGFRGSRSST